MAGMFETPQTQNLLSQQALALGGYGAIPQINRSQYLADALKALQESASTNIKNPAALGSNLLAEALLQMGRRRSDKELISGLSAGQSAQVAGDRASAYGPDTPPPPPQAPAGFMGGQPPAPPPAAESASAPASFGGPASSPSARLMAQLIKDGLTPPAAAGMVGNFRAESGPNFNQDNPAEGAIGIANWRGPRAQAAQAYFAAHGGPTLENQADFAAQELPKDIGPQRYAALLAAPDAASAAGIATSYERPRGWTPNGNPANVAGWQTRLAGAQDAMGSIQSNNPPPPPAPPPQAQGAPQQPPQQAQPQGQPPQPAQLQPLMGLAANPVERAQIEAGLRAPVGSARYMEAAQRLHEISLRTSQQRGYHIVNQNGVNVAIDDYTGQQVPLPIPPQVQNRNGDASQFGINAPRGTQVTMSPMNVPTVVDKPPEGYQDVGGRMMPEPGGPVDPTAGQHGIDNARSLNERFRSDVNPIVSVNNQFGQIKTALTQGTTAADQAALVAYMRLINPTARVQPGQLAPMDGTVPEQFAAILNRLTQTSGTMTPEERSQLLQAAQPIYQQALTQYDAISKNYRDRATSMGIDPTQIIEPLPPIAAGPPPMQHPQAGAPQQAPQNAAGGGRRLSPQEAAQLPRGTHFVGMDGIERVVH